LLIAEVLGLSVQGGHASSGADERVVVLRGNGEQRGSQAKELALWIKVGGDLEVGDQVPIYTD
jgi:hypothetical protein